MIVYILLLASSLVGLGTGLCFQVWTLIFVSPLVAVVSAAVLQLRGFGLATVILLAIGCLGLSQLAYVIGAFVSLWVEGPIAEEIGDTRGSHGEQKILRERERRVAGME